MKIHTIAVMGAGAVGCYFLDGLSEKFGENLWTVASGQRAERLKRDGLTVNGRRLALNVRTPEEARGADLLLVAVKYGALKPCVDDIEKVVAEHTTVMSLLNGVDSETVIAERIGMEHIVYSMMKIASERKDNEVVFDPEVTQGVYFGETDRGDSGINAESGESDGRGRNADSGESDRRIAAIAEAFEGTKIRYTICDDIIRDIWFKYALNISKNLPQAMVNCGFGAYTSSEYVAALSRRLEEEVAAVAKAKGIDLSDKNNAAGKNSAISPKARFSTLQDLDAGRHTEIDMFSGAMMRMGRELGIPTPYNEFTYYMIKALEEKNDGLLP